MTPERPVRVIYAKLTSTGAYDVVASTPNVPLERARSLAERLLPGNPPLDTDVREEIAHLRPPEGGHIILRFARYDWADGGRGDVYATDILWVSDADFARVRCNAFSLVPRTDRIFEVFTELPLEAVRERPAAADLARVAELRSHAEPARMLVASALAADPVLLLQPDERLSAMELFVLLLPPSLRAALTFQTQAFRVPALLPRVTLADRAYANLREGPWRILPDIDTDVPYPLATQFVALSEDVERLGFVHEMYDGAYSDVVDLRTGITRLTRLAAIADALLAKSAVDAVPAILAADAPARVAALRVLQRSVSVAELSDALLQMIRTGGTGGLQATEVLRSIDDDDYAAQVTARLMDALPAGASEELVAELAVRAARAGDLARLVLLVARDRRTVTGRVPLDDGSIAEPGRSLALAIRDASGPRQDLAAAARLLATAAAAAPLLHGAAARDALHRICRDATIEALERAPATIPAVKGLLQLQDVAPGYVAALQPGIPLPPLFTPDELRRPDALQALQSVADHYTTEASAVLGTALVARALAAVKADDAAECTRACAAAAQLIDRAGRPLARQYLLEQNVPDHEVAVWPGGQALAEAIGVDTRQAGTTRRLREAIHTLHTQPERGVQELAVAVLAARAQHIRLTRGTQLWTEVVDALRARPNGGARTDTNGAEIGLELLAVLTESEHLHELEDAALDGALAVRLRRLDRSISVCRAAEDETRYERLARAIESDDVPLDQAARERLRTALGTRGLQRRLMRMVSRVVEGDA